MIEQSDLLKLKSDVRILSISTGHFEYFIKIIPIPLAIKLMHLTTVPTRVLNLKDIDLGSFYIKAMQSFSKNTYIVLKRIILNI
jgi:hypothetical protein